MPHGCASADECRKIARLVHDEAECASYERLAKAYDVLAREEQLLSKSQV
jgi:hypothetical protein